MKIKERGISGLKAIKLASLVINELNHLNLVHGKGGNFSHVATPPNHQPLTNIIINYYIFIRIIPIAIITYEL